MKDAISIHDYLFDVADIGDWEGDEELVTDKVNAVYHSVWQALPDDITADQVEHLLPGIWDQLRGGTVLLEADEDELIDWALAYVRQQLEEGIPQTDTADEEE
ncbi:hypothetical protein HRH59_11000 [Rheinheimera sp. YQF-2]|jgi:hypothetical protein|uniref:Uncharacterized protein n=1 Tax=Rheinheimera lutimaris TaxID=2740584 RepID=A0A7Y5AR91_9GAMM|nr:hypothetical protein [Rheinheimera lutimaris]NRQ43072.1 hypothetical protein [Rheinheimera lutimaris]